MNNAILTEVLNPNRGPVIGDVVMYIDNIPGILTNKVLLNITILNSATKWKSLYPPIPVETSEQIVEDDDEYEEYEEEDA